jgi:hypothetical protein
MQLQNKGAKRRVSPDRVGTTCLANALDYRPSEKTMWNYIQTSKIKVDKQRIELSQISSFL